MKDLTKLSKIDLHIHTTVSDGTDTPMELLSKVKEAGLELFAVTDHDAISGAAAIHDSLSEDDPCFIPGIEWPYLLGGACVLLLAAAFMVVYLRRTREGK